MIAQSTKDKTTKTGWKNIFVNIYNDDVFVGAYKAGFFWDENQDVICESLSLKRKILKSFKKLMECNESEFEDLESGRWKFIKN